MPILEIKNLNVRYTAKQPYVHACDDICLDIEERDSMGIVGESGSGKSTLAMCVLGLLPRNSVQTDGEIVFQGRNILNLPKPEYAKIRWKDISAVFQKSMNSLSPVHKIIKQMSDIYRVHNPNASSDECRNKAQELLAKVNLPRHIGSMYPHQLSGGMLQRVSIALCLMFSPSLVILDEATTALDVVTESRILREIEELRESERITCLMITHNMAVVATSCQKIVVMYAGRIVETGLTSNILKRPRHPYTVGLVKSFPSFRDGEQRKLSGIAGSLPDLSVTIRGCVFAPRCPQAADRCFAERPPLLETEPGWKSACFFSGGLS